MISYWLLGWRDIPEVAVWFILSVRYGEWQLCFVCLCFLTMFCVQIPANCIEKLKEKDESFTRVSLPANSLYKSSPDETTIELCNALKDNPHCVEVDISGCGISNAGAEAIANLLADNTVIKKLDLSNNKVRYLALSSLVLTNFRSTALDKKKFLLL